MSNFPQKETPSDFCPPSGTWNASLLPLQDNCDPFSVWYTPSVQSTEHSHSSLKTCGIEVRGSAETVVFAYFWSRRSARWTTKFVQNDQRRFNCGECLATSQDVSIELANSDLDYADGLVRTAAFATATRPSSKSCSLIWHELDTFRGATNHCWLLQYLRSCVTKNGVHKYTRDQRCPWEISWESRRLWCRTPTTIRNYWSETNRRHLVRSQHADNSNYSEPHYDRQWSARNSLCTKEM